MAGVAESAVLVSSAGAAEAVTRLKRVQGPSSHFHDAQHVLSFYPAMGFQATNFGHACHIAERMLRRQAPSKVYQIKDGKYVLVRHDETESEGEKQSEGAAEDAKEGRRAERKRRPICEDDLVYPTLFLGVTANLFGTGCREAIRFLVQEGVAPNPAAAQYKEAGGSAALPDDATEDQLMFARLKKEYREACSAGGDSDHGRALPDEAAAPPPFRSFLSAIVVSGGGVEHDVRRACAAYTVTHYSSEVTARTQAGSASPHAPAHFGNVSYPSQGSEASALFDAVMCLFVQRLCSRQRQLRTAAAAKPAPEKYLDVCSWSVTPSEVWALLGLWLVDILAEALHKQRHGAKGGDAGEAAAVAAASGCAASPACASCRAAALASARSTVVYWAAVQQVPVYSPSFVDGDIAAYILPDSATEAVDPTAEPLQVDLVRDIHAINKLAMQSKKTGMLICGGGVVKHHICNANLMRNGADYTVILNNGQEFDGSDAGAKPEEALSWGKVRMEGEFVKVYGEITTYLPLLVAQVFVPAVRQRNRRRHTVASALTSEATPRATACVGGEGAKDTVTKSRRNRRLPRKQQRRQSAAGDAASPPSEGSTPTIEESAN